VKSLVKINWILFSPNFVSGNKEDHYRWNH